MKRLIAIVFAALLALTAAAQDGKESVVFYGIDFSLARVAGNADTAPAIIEAYGQINAGLLKESDKYLKLLGRKTSMNVDRIDVQAVMKAATEIDPEDVIVMATPEELGEADIKMALLDLDIPKGEGTGLVVVAGGLDKGAGKGVFHYVFFDRSDKAVLGVKTLSGQPGAGSFKTRWSWAFYSSIFSLNPSKAYLKSKELRQKISDGANQVKEAVL